MEPGGAGRPAAPRNADPRLTATHSARLLLPALRADGASRFDPDAIDRAIQAQTGGFILFGGEAVSVSEAIREIRGRFAYPILMAADLERGAGQQFAGLTRLPPPAALASLGNPEITRRAGRITGRQARSVGIDLVFAPVADLDVLPDNPIIGTRAFGGDPVEVGRHVRAWVEGCLAGGALPCPKHFPGHGRSHADSHMQSISVPAPADLLGREMEPFRGAIAGGAPALMTAHLRYPALDPEHPATFSPAILGDLLRGRLRFAGAVVSDSLVMEGAGGGGAGDPAVAALLAGCDLLLDPADPEAASRALATAGRAGAERVTAALGQRQKLLDSAAAMNSAPDPPSVAEDDRWAADVARQAVHWVRGPVPFGSGWRLIEIEDDAGGPYALPSRTTLRNALAERIRGGPATPLVAIYSDPRAFKGRAGLSVETVARVRAACGQRPDAVVLLCSHPRNARDLPFARHIVCAWGGDAVMQEGAARFLLDPPSVPTNAG